MASWVDDVRQWPPPVTDESSISGTLQNGVPPYIVTMQSVEGDIEHVASMSTFHVHRSKHGISIQAVNQHLRVVC